MLNNTPYLQIYKFLYFFTLFPLLLLGITGCETNSHNRAYQSNVIWTYENYDLSDPAHTGRVIRKWTIIDTRYQIIEYVQGGIDKTLIRYDPGVNGDSQGVLTSDAFMKGEYGIRFDHLDYLRVNTRHESTYYVIVSEQHDEEPLVVLRRSGEKIELASEEGWSLVFRDFIAKQSIANKSFGHTHHFSERFVRICRFLEIDIPSFTSK